MEAMKRRDLVNGKALLPAPSALASKTEIERAEVANQHTHDNRMQDKLLTTGILAIALVGIAVTMFVPSGTSRDIVLANQAPDRITTVYKSMTGPSKARLVEAACANGGCLDV